MARRKLCPSTTFEILPLSTCTLYTMAVKILYLQKYSTDLRNLCPARRCWGCAFGFKVSGAQVFYFWNFADFILYTVPAKILYLQRYSNDFRTLLLISKMLKVDIWVESFRWADILLLQWQGEKFAHRKHLKIYHFQLVHCASKNPTPPKVFYRFSKSLPALEDVEGGHLGVKFQVRRYFTFGMPTWKLWTSKTFEILPLSTCTLCQ